MEESAQTIEQEELRTQVVHQAAGLIEPAPQVANLDQVAMCCGQELFLLPLRLLPMTFEETTLVALGELACLRCGAIANHDGAAIKGHRLSQDILGTFASIRDRMTAARTALAAGTATNAGDGGMPTSEDFLEMCFFRRAAPAGMFLDWEAVNDDEAQLRDRMKRMLGFPGGRPRPQIQTPLHSVTPSMYTIDHVFEVEEDGSDNRDRGHLLFYPLIRQTLEKPIEIWLQQPRGSKSRRWLYLSLYEVGREFVYHVVIVTRQKEILTGYALEYGAKAAKKREGVLVHLGY